MLAAALGMFQRLRTPPYFMSRGSVLASLVLAIAAHACDPDHPNFSHPCQDCTAGSLSVRYDTVYYVPDHIGSLYGWDASDPRYRVPETGEPFGGWATPVYTHPTETSANLFLTSRHIAEHDDKYLECMGVKAIANLGAVDLYPYWNGYPAYYTNHNDLPVISMVYHEWPKRLPVLAAFIDEQLSAGNSTAIYDEDGCLGAGSAAIAYVMLKRGQPFTAVFDSLLSKRRCLQTIMGGQDDTTEWPPEYFLNNLLSISV